MDMKIRRFIAMTLTLLILVSTVYPTISQAVPEKRYLTFIEYMKDIEERSEKVWDRPSPKITATTPTGEIAEADAKVKPEDGSEFFTDRLIVPDPVLTVKVGTKINLDPNQSTVGSGTLIDNWDWQIFTNSPSSHI